MRARRILRTKSVTEEFSLTEGVWNSTTEFKKLPHFMKLRENSVRKTICFLPATSASINAVTFSPAPVPTHTSLLTKSPVAVGVALSFPLLSYGCKVGTIQHTSTVSPPQFCSSSSIACWHMRSLCRDAWRLRGVKLL